MGGAIPQRILCAFLVCYGETFTFKSYGAPYYTILYILQVLFSTVFKQMSTTVNNF